ncbi:tetratricopeptide repeat protein [Actinomadura sp. K4S16]|uniref:tetratricopeptide repeat protein n=1 Tax=Actinomadura sp. K4S16 TaxID=1316147 RepID=UPI0011F050E7|nr:tetratricopeptide repeat protein [Actinomadura sp. K4S16]
MNKDIVALCEEILVRVKSGDQVARKRMSEIFPDLQKMADSGRADAQALVGGLALEYIRDLDAAAYYFRLAAEAANPAGQRGLGHMMANGMGMKRDIEGAVKLFDAAANAGDSIAAFNLGSILLKGIGVAPDEIRAITLLKDASTAGVPAAAALLADWYADHEEYEKAKLFYLDAAAGGMTNAMLTLGEWYAEGIGGEVDRIEAVRWLLKPIDFGDGDGVHDAIQIARAMTDAEIREAATRAGREADADALINTVRSSG